VVVGIADMRPAAAFAVANRGFAIGFVVAAYMHPLELPAVVEHTYSAQSPVAFLSLCRKLYSLLLPLHTRFRIFYNS